MQTRMHRHKCISSWCVVVRLKNDRTGLCTRLRLDISLVPFHSPFLLLLKGAFNSLWSIEFSNQRCLLDFLSLVPSYIHSSSLCPSFIPFSLYLSLFAHTIPLVLTDRTSTSRAFVTFALAAGLTGKSISDCGSLSSSTSASRREAESY